jgi:hypothetical protein
MRLGALFRPARHIETRENGAPYRRGRSEMNLSGTDYRPRSTRIAPRDVPSFGAAPVALPRKGQGGWSTSGEQD